MSFWLQINDFKPTNKCTYPRHRIVYVCVVAIYTFYKPIHLLVDIQTIPIVAWSCNRLNGFSNLINVFKVFQVLPLFLISSFFYCKELKLVQTKERERVASRYPSDVKSLSFIDNIINWWNDMLYHSSFLSNWNCLSFLHLRLKRRLQSRSVTSVSWSKLSRTRRTLSS